METRDEEKEKFLVLLEKSDNKIGIILHSYIFSQLCIDIIDKVVRKLQLQLKVTICLGRGGGCHHF